MLNEKLNIILSELAELEKEHGYFVLATNFFLNEEGKFHRVPSL